MTTETRSEYIERSSAIIAQSHLSGADKKMLIGRISFVADSILEMFVQVCDEDPFGIDAVVRNLKKKLDAQGNLKTIHEIVKQENHDIEELLNAHALI